MRDWLIAFAIIAGVVIAARIYMSVRKLRRELAERQDWDTKVIERLRRAPGADPFKAVEVDFFFGLPDEVASQAVNAVLEQEGFVVDIKAVPEDKEFPYSLHARKGLRLSVPEMKGYSRRFTVLAEQNRGRYDGWMAESERVPVKREPRRIGRRPRLF